MAKKKRKPTHRRKSRRVSGVKDLDMTMLALTVGGAVAGRILSNKLAASTNTTMQKLAPYASIAAGIVIPMVTKNAMLKGISVGLVAAGGITALGPTGLKVISGIEQTVGRIGYPYNVLPYRNATKVAGLVQNGQYISKANFSGSGKNQMNVIGGVSSSMDGGPMGY